MKMLLLTTTDQRAGRRAALARLMRSLEAARCAGVEIESRLLVQNMCADQSAGWAPPAFVHCRRINGRASLSDARNLLLDDIPAAVLADQRLVVGFPDDDCWYPDGFLSRLAGAFESDPRLDLFVCGFGAQPVEWGAAAHAPRAARFRDVVRRTSSNNFFVRGPLASQLGGFDPALGLGAPSGSGEDTEYAIRAFFRGRASMLVDAPLVGHPENNLAKISVYYRGDLAVLARFASRNRAAFAEFGRKIGVGAYLTASRRMRLADYAAALRFGASELVSPSRSHPARPPA